MRTLKRNEETGAVEAWEDGKKVGEVISMGDIEMSSEGEGTKEEGE